MTESSHNLTGAKTILSVRAQRQHLFVLEKMILTLIKIYCFQQEVHLRLLLPCVVVCLPPQNNYTTKIAAVQLSFIPICADALAAEWRLI